MGAEVVELELADLDLMSPVGTTICVSEGSCYHRRLLRERGSDLDPVTRVMLELGELIPATHYVTAQRARAVLRDGVRSAFSAHSLDVMLTPTVPTTSVPMELVSQASETAEDPLSAAIHLMLPPNITGQPALTVPCGFSAAGLPIGFQLMGRPFDEATLFRLARAYERNHDHWARVPSLARR
jgi:aspartyl-tRNA(Asn)/glutamyl-tRNA(Gln) amidotransferase subunit A